MTQGAVGFAENNRRVKCGGFISAVERERGMENVTVEDDP